MLRELTGLALPAALLLSSSILSSSTGAYAQVAPQKIDETALRYYASSGQTARVTAEIKRISLLDPAWRAPDDLAAARESHPDEAALWVLYKQDRMAEIDKAIAYRQSVEPGWMPSEDLAAKLKSKVLRADIITLAKSQEWHAIVQSFKQNGIAWAKDDAEALWIIAEAYARENDCGEAYVVYRSILANHTDVAERRATIEHAIALIPMSYAEKLIAMGQANSVDEFKPIELDITRARISAFLHDEVANGVTPDAMARFEDAVHESADPNEPGLVAWYDFKRRDYKPALDWFKLAIGRGGDAMIAHGLAHTLRKLDMKREAEEVAYAWREPLVNNAILFIDLLETDLTKEQPPFVEPERIVRYAKVTMATESGEGAQALGWYAYNTCQYSLALQWFQRATAWLPKEATTYGYALSLQRLHKAKEFREVVNRWDGLFPKTVALAFDDGLRRPPPPCETNIANPSAPPREPVAAEAGPDWTGRTMADTLKAQPRAAIPVKAGFIRARVPSPDVAAGSAEAADPTLVKKTDFPVAVAPENPLRFSALKTNAAEDQIGRDTAHGLLMPLVARRVPGVGAMPYERFGFTLLKGWDGTTDASSPTAAERAPPVGTLWALEQSLRDGGKGQTSDKTTGTLPRRHPLTRAGVGGAYKSDRHS